MNKNQRVVQWVAACLMGYSFAVAAPQLPRMQVEPQPYQQVSFQRDGTELARYHFGSSLHRPFIFPVVGPSGRSLTRMGHPRAPVSHSHHTSVWVSHHDVNGQNFWVDSPKGPRIAHQFIEAFEDSDGSAAVVSVNAWVGADGQTLLRERRRIAAQPLQDREWLLILDLQLEAVGAEVILGKTPFGLVGVRMAKSIGVRDGGGSIRNAEGGVNEAGAFRKPARWVDYSGAIAPDVTEGITLMDHPANPNHPTVFHVRDDGWMGACLTYDGPRTVTGENPLRVRYGLYVHAGAPPREALDRRWKVFAGTTPFVFTAKPAMR